MNINNLLELCNINLRYNINTTNDILIRQASYIDSCEELETLIESDTDNIIVKNLDQNLNFLTENFQNNNNTYNDQFNDVVINNFLMGIFVIFAILMFMISLPNGF